MMLRVANERRNCQECGSEDLSVTTLDGVTVEVCGLCGALGGAEVAVQKVLRTREARAHGVDVQVWPLVRVLGGLPGLAVLQSHGGDVAVRSLPFVQFGATGEAGIFQLENLCKSLAVSARQRRLLWVVEAEYTRQLAFSLKPRIVPGHWTPAVLADAQHDLEAIAAALQRDVRLSYWRHPPSK
jgi:hypothetical protein